MIFEIILAIIIGLIAGTITGLIPGIHVNLIALALLTISPFLLTYFPLNALLVFIVSMSITHTFIDFIPSIFLGSPDDDTGLSILPGHHFLNKGKGYEAIIYTLYGSLIAIPIILLLAPLFIFLLPKIFEYLQSGMFFILLISSVYLVLKEENDKFLALIVFMIAGFLGISTLNLNIENSLMPLLTGLFGSSSLITSIIKKQKIPRQKLTSLKKIKLKKAELARVSLASILSAPICSFLPSLGSNQAAVIGIDVLGNVSRKEFLVLLGTINTVVMGLSFVTLFAISRARTGAAATIQQLTSLSLYQLNLILVTVVLSAIASFFLAIFIARFFAKIIAQFNYRKLSWGLIGFLALMSLIFSGFMGLLVFIIATFTGLVAILSGIRRTHLMGSLMLPTILLYLPF
ncbi:MAG: tripartite tricarboxylate transporter permease [archaeon]